ncbi:MAG: CHASE2 domain-containing protein [Desulfuromonadaceae bacterium]|nr:CHASE2 domain-containing protein [Desulfuromonadaceae bacterium]MDD5107054.1 CHASE2 domain-containing protein [Desulfuromonadaceae bacterium]
MFDPPSPRNVFQRFRPLREGRGFLLAVGLFLTIVHALLLIYQPLLMHQAELRLYDLMLSGRVESPKSHVPVLVGIDEESLHAYGQWPWPRYRLARLVERLHELGAVVVVLDFLMPEPDRTSPGVIISERLRDNETTPVDFRNSSDDSNSLELAKALAKGTSVLGFYFDFTETTALTEHNYLPVLPEGLVIHKAADIDAAWPKPTAMIRTIEPLRKGVRAEGFTNALHDRDGALRRVPLLLSYNGTCYPSLAMAALLLTSSERTLRLNRNSSETWLVWNDRHIPLDREGNLLIDFRSDENTFPYYSARSILKGGQAQGALKGKIVLVGPWAKGLGDEHLTPSGKSVGGLNIHATIIDTILSGTFITRPDWAKGAELCAVLCIGILSTLLLSRSGFGLSLVAVSVTSIGSYWGMRELLVAKGIYLSPLMPMLTPIVILTVLSSLKYRIEYRKVKQRTLDLIDAQDTIIISMSALAEARDKETGKHILRTQRYVEILIRELTLLPKYAELDEGAIELIIKSAPLHDIGKVGIPDCILQKPGALNDSEYAVMKGHTTIGVDALSKTIKGTGHPEQQDFLHYAQQMIESHHERWDGCGYPYGLSGDDIPLSGRLMALADVYDALVSHRIYKEGFSHEKARDMIVQGSGKQFDPEVVTAFYAKNEEFYTVAKEYADTPEGDEQS